MRPLTVSCLLVALAHCACGEPRPRASAPRTAAPPLDTAAALAAIDTLGGRLFPDGMAAGTDTARAWPYVRAVERFAERAPRHPRTPDLLLGAAGIANGTGWANKAIELWGYAWRNAPAHPRAPEALFYQGFVMETAFADTANALRYYGEFLGRYPDHALGNDVRKLRALLSEQTSPGGRQPTPPRRTGGSAPPHSPRR